MEQEKQAFFPRLMSILLIAMGIFLGFYAFFANATVWDINGNSWDNSNYITSDFWTYGPSTGDIIQALYGSTSADITAYTQNRSGNICDYNTLTVETLNPGTDTIPRQLSGNTVYVLNSGDYIIDYTTGVKLNDCSAIIGSGNVTFYSTYYILAPYAMIYVTGVQNNILDNIRVNGIYNSQNQIGVAFYSSPNNSFNALKVYNNGFYGIRITNSPESTINNSQTYNNNGDGISFATSPQSIINNSQSYNNNGNGISFATSPQSIINNSQLYNNNNDGISLTTSIEHIINNSQSYNNNGDGISFVISTGNIINNSQAYNNNDRGISFTSSYGNIYYGDLSLFGNGNTALATTYITGGYSSDSIVLGVGWDTGVLNTGGTLSRDYITNPMNQNGVYLLDRGTGFTHTRGRKSFIFDQSLIFYSYGSGILTQTQPVVYNGPNLVPGGTFNSIKYIGSDIIKKTGTLLGISSNVDVTNLSITGMSSSVTQYSLFGDIINYIYGEAIGNTTGITLTGGEGTKRIITQLYSPTTYFATHFETKTILAFDYTPNSFTFSTITGADLNISYTSNTITLTGMSNGVFTGISVSSGYMIKNGSQTGISLTGGNGDQFVLALTSSVNYATTVSSTMTIAGVSDVFSITTKSTIPSSIIWDNNNFINESFWLSGPNTTDIIQALYGSTSGDITAYTQNRSGNICNYNTLTVQTLYPGLDTIPNQLSGNTIYVLNSGDYKISYTNGIMTDTCSSIIGSGNVTIYSTGKLNNSSAMIYFNEEQNVVVDNVHIDGTGDGDGGNHTGNYVGIFIDYSLSNTINNVEAYNTTHGIHFNYSSYNTINNSHIYNNTAYGIQLLNSSNNIINDSQSYNNNAGIFINYGSGNNINNSQAYNNNSPGMFLFYTTNNSINNSQAYNNNNGIHLANSSNNSINNSQTHNNTSNGISIYYSLDNNINNSQIYDNYDGVHIYNSTGNIINHSTAYNNSFGIDINNSSDNSITGVQVFSNQIGIYLQSNSKNNNINNSQAHDNVGAGIMLDNSTNNSINNSQALNNNDEGIYLNSNSNNNSINNSQALNNKVGIYLNSNSNNNSINNSKFYNNYNNGIYLANSSDYNIINNSQAYNNTEGIYLDSSSGNNINNSQSYNNTSHGIIIYGSSGNNINNSQLFNNLVGININQSSENSINNSQLFNNLVGIKLVYSTNNIINNTQSYNNVRGMQVLFSNNNIINNTRLQNNRDYSMIFDSSTGNKYYGELLSMTDAINNLIGTNGFDVALSGGLSNDSIVSALGWTNGVLNTGGTMSRDYITNPLNISGNYLLPRGSGFADMKQQNTGYASETIVYSYGSGILTQRQPVIYSGALLVTGLTFDTTKYIGSDTVKKTGDLVGLSGNMNSNIISLMGISTTTSQYSLFGDITNYIYGQSINTATGVILLGGGGVKTIITQLYSGTNFATHFAKTGYLNPTLADVTPPVISIGYIYSGFTENNGATSYYKGTVDIKANVSDDVGISGATCMYTTGTSRASASYSGTTTTGYCYTTGIVEGAPLNIAFKVQDTSTNISTGAEKIYIYDGTAPTFTFANNSGYECITGTLSITNANDTGVGLPTTPYSFDGGTWGIATGITIDGDQSSVTVSIPGHTRDIFGNFGILYAVYSFNNVAPSGTNFTGSTNVGNSAKTTNWLLSSNAQEGACGNGDITFSGFVSQGTKGICTQAGSTGITYTPNTNQTGTDTCVIQIKDNENSTGNVIITWAGIDIINYIPNQFTFNPITGANLNTLYTSNIVTISGMSNGVFMGISVSSGYMIKNGSQTGISLTGGNGDQFVLALTSSVNYATTVSSTMTIAGVTGSFVLTTTDNPDATPPSVINVSSDKPNGTYRTAGEVIDIKAQFSEGVKITGTPALRLNTSPVRTGIYLDMGLYDVDFNRSSSGLDNIITTIALQSDGKIIAGGYFSTYSGASANKIIRLNSDGTRDTTFNIGGGFNDSVNSIALQSDGKIIAGGMFRTYSGATLSRIIRLNINGTRDTTFNIGGGIGGLSNRLVTSLALQSDGKIIVGGSFSTYNGVSANNITRLNTNGAIDTTFTIGSGFDNYVWSLAPQSDGKIIVGGDFTTYSGVNANRIIRLNSDGTRDTTFNIGQGFDVYGVTSLALQSDGKIIAGGGFTTYSGVSANKIIRLNTDGTRDTTFNIGGGFNNSVTSLALQSDGKIIAGGNFTTYSGATAIRIIRLNTDGTRDTTFNIGGGFNQDVYSLALQSDGKIIAGGSFTQFNSSPVKYLARLSEYSNTKIFRYIVQSGDNSSDLDYANTGALSLSGGTIQDMAGNNAILTLASPGSTGSLGTNKDIFIGAPDTILPLVSTGHISSGTTGNNGATSYYKGTVDIKADVSDNIGINGTTCMYTTGISRASASYSGTTTTGYCYKTGVVGGAPLNIVFKVQDTSTNISTGAEKTYVYDGTAPTFTFANNSGYECITGTLSITNANDTGVGLPTTPYSFDGGTWGIATGITIDGDQSSVTVSIPGHTRDMFGNFGILYAVYSFNNVAPSGTNFTGSTNVGNSAKTTNWLLSSNAQEGACGNGDITFSGFVSQGTKGICTQAGSTGITYTPNTNQTGTDTCVIQIKDNENSTGNVIITWAGIDTTTPDNVYPTVTTGYIYSGSIGYNTPNYYYKGTVDIKATVSDDIGISGATCMYTTGTSRASALYSGTTTTGYCYKTGIVGGADIHISFRVQDTANNLTTGSEKTYVYDSTAPTFTFSDTSTTEATSLILYVSGASDTGIGLAISGYNFSTNGSTRNGRQTNSDFSLGTQNEPTSTGLRAKVRDTLGNESTAVLATGTWTNIAPTANNLTGSTIESTAILFTATGSDLGNTTFSYKRYTGAVCGGNVLSTSQTFTGSNNEPGILVRSYQLIDAQLLSGCAIVTGTWTNVAPLATFTYNNNQIINTPIIWTGIGMDTGTTFSYQWYYDAACSTVAPGETSLSTSVTLAVAGTTGRYVKISDNQGSGSNCTGGIGVWYTSDTTPPIVSTGYVYSGTTGNNGATLYYKGTVDIKADVSDNIQISGTSCMYTTGGVWASASYYGTTVAGYCYKTGIVGGAPLNIAFRIQDITGNVTTGTTDTYLYDATAPTFTFANAVGYECTPGVLSIASANDTGVGLHATPYGFDGITWGIITGITIPTQSTTGIITKTGYVRDILTNILSIGATYTFLNIGVTANNFTGHTNVGYIPRTVDWKTGSSAAEGSCGSGDIIYSGIVTQGTKGICTVTGNNITYSPAIEQSGSDTCVIQIKDNENSTGNITITWTGIDSVGIIPDYSFTGITQTGLLITSGGYYNTGIRITFTGLIISGATLDGIPYVSGSLITGDATHIFLLQDTLGHSTGITFIIDMIPPTFTGTTLSSLSVTSGGYYTTGITITFSDLHLSGATLNGSGYTGGTLITGDRVYVFLVKDTLGNSTGMTFTIDTTNPSITSISPANGTTINTTSNVVFTWNGLDTNMSGYAIYITGTQIQTLITTGTSITSTLANGTYTRYVIATDRAGNTGVSIPATFTVTAPFLPVMTMLTGNLQSNTTGRYTKDVVSISLRTNKAANYSFTGNFTTPLPPFVDTGLNGVMTGTFTLTTGDGQKSIYLSATDGSTTTGKTFTLYLDTTAPSIPTLISPTSGSATSGAFTISWYAASDTGIGLSGYQYFISTTGTIGTGIVTSGYTTSTSKSFTNGEIGTSGTFYRYVKSIDRLGNSGTSASQPFSYTGILDTTPNTFTLNTIIDALTDRIYRSNTITIAGLSANTQVLASINRGFLYINGTMVGSTGYVQNGSTVKIELVSSSDYNTLVSSILTIGGVSATFRITTESETTTTTTTTTSTSLSATAKLQIIAIFEALRDVYAGVKQSEFLNSFMVMLQSKIDDLGTSTADKNTRYALQYMYDLVDNYRGNIGTTSDITTISDIVNGIYTAPNGKKYTITYNSTIKQFTSPNFLTPKYFVTRDSFKYIIDINNPAGSSYLSAKAIKARRGKIHIDGTWQTSPYTAPNRKVFYFFKTMEGQYSSYTFTVEKYFDSLDAVKEFIHNSTSK